MDIIEKTFPADTAVLDDVLSFTEDQLERASCPPALTMSLTMAIEEMFVNVAHYAYPDGGGNVQLSIAFAPDSHVITFQLTDSGIPFDPLAQPAPDLSIPAEERPIGGLGIYIMLKVMDAVQYERIEGHNILTMQKTLLQLQTNISSH